MTVTLRPPEQRDFPSRLHHPRVAAQLGAWLGSCFFVAFATGVISHLAQQPDSWLPSRPVWGYRVTQGIHVAAGSACVPLLVAKLWTVYPRLWIRPPKPVRELALHAAERASIGVLVAAAIFQLVIGLANVTTWYPWSFSFRATHFAVGWVAIGALVVHIAVKLPVFRAALAAPAPDEPEEAEPRGATVEVTSLQEHGPFRVTHLPGQFADDDLTLLALALDGEALSIDHGFPFRLIAPNRPGVFQTKWVSRLEVRT